jgi:uncharacterized cupredoxin-like copper-binding protein
MHAPNTSPWGLRTLIEQGDLTMNATHATVTPTLAAIAMVTAAGLAQASGDHSGGHDESGGKGFAFGEPAAASAADRTVEIVAKDTMRYAPAELAVDSGETVRFVVKNVGQLQHSFTLAPPAAQRAHEQEMKDMAMAKMASHMEGDPTGIVVQPGETGSLTWRFTHSEPIQFACHIPGHYPAGMKGRINFNK